MIFGLISDTHTDRANALPHIIAEFKKRDVEIIIHCGDIEKQHVDPEKFGNIPVVCALNEEQLEKPEFENTPEGWKFTKPGKRIEDLCHIRCYIGHKRSFDFLRAASESDFQGTIDDLRNKSDGLRWVFAGHTHHQILLQTQLVNFVNPGAVEDSLDGYEFAVVDTQTNEIVFCRIPKTKPLEKPFSVGLIADSLNISNLDVEFWKKLAEEFKKRDVRHIIHCGNIAMPDIGCQELTDFTVHFWLRPDQIPKPKTFPDNWRLISPQEPVVKINGRQFYIQSNLARILLEESEIEMHKKCLETLEVYPEVNVILYGGTNEAFLEEGQRARIINPGDCISNRNFCVICFPRVEITFGHVPIDPLGPLE